MYRCVLSVGGVEVKAGKNLLLNNGSKVAYAGACTLDGSGLRVLTYLDATMTKTLWLSAEGLAGAVTAYFVFVGLEYMHIDESMALRIDNAIRERRQTELESVKLARQSVNYALEKLMEAIDEHSSDSARILGAALNLTMADRKFVEATREEKK